LITDEGFTTETQRGRAATNAKDWAGVDHRHAAFHHRVTEGTEEDGVKQMVEKTPRAEIKVK
jgi:DNA-binding GntR family transcriptional regulator